MPLTILSPRKKYLELISVTKPSFNENEVTYSNGNWNYLLKNIQTETETIFFLKNVQTICFA